MTVFSTINSPFKHVFDEEMKRFLIHHTWRRGDRPFFLYLSYQQAHVPNQVEEEYLRRVYEKMLLKRCSKVKDKDGCMQKFREEFVNDVNLQRRLTHLGALITARKWFQFGFSTGLFSGSIRA